MGISIIRDNTQRVFKKYKAIYFCWFYLQLFCSSISSWLTVNFSVTVIRHRREKGRNEEKGRWVWGLETDPPSREDGKRRWNRRMEDGGRAFIALYVCFISLVPGEKGKWRVTLKAGNQHVCWLPCAICRLFCLQSEFRIMWHFTIISLYVLCAT